MGKQILMLSDFRFTYIGNAVVCCIVNMDKSVVRFCFANLSHFAAIFGVCASHSVVLIVC